MKKLMLIAAGLLSATSALAADLPRSNGAYYSPSSVYNWGGFYAGANLGYEWGKVTNSNMTPSGLTGGIQGGYNWQQSQWVYGAEADLNLSGADDTFAPWKFSNPWFGTIRGRIGYAFNNILAYGTGGIAFGNVRGERGGISEDKTQFGWALGLGAEIGLTANWSAKAEYLYMDLGSRTYTTTGVNNGFHSSVLRLGVNYHF